MINIETIADIYVANEKVRTRLAEVVAGLDASEATALPEGEKWSIQQIVEHLSMVEFGTSRICARILGEAEAAGKPSDGHVVISGVIEEMSADLKDRKVEAPERVHPTGQLSIDQAFTKMEENRKAFSEMRPVLESFDLSDHKFPHPYFGDITAPEWMIVMGGHEARHIRQIEKLLEKIRQ